jgi:ABC-type Fe3+/spermidine/putrescine transport system ATPase subunit
LVYIMAVIKISNLDLEYQGQKVSNFMLTIPDRQTTTISGDEESGKDTLLAGLLGFTSISFGTITVDEVEVQSLAPGKRGFVCISSDWGLFPHLNVRANLGYGLRFRKLPKEERELKIDRFLRQFRLTELQNLFPHMLSVNEQYRLALGRAAIVDPELLILDDSFSNFDVPVRESLVTYTHEIQNILGLTIAFITKNPMEVMGVSTHIAVMADGYLEQTGKVQDVYDSPTSTRVAKNTGEINILRAQVVMGGDFYMFSTKLGGLNLRCAEKLRPDTDVDILIRPEQTQVVPLGQTADARNVFSGQIRQIRYVSGFQFLSIKTDDEQLFLSVQNPQHSFGINDDIDVILSRDEYPIVKRQ